VRRWSQEAIDRRLGHEDGPSPEELYLDGLEMDRRRLEERDRLYPPCRSTAGGAMRRLPARVRCRRETRATNLYGGKSWRVRQE
jgi:hypothetical protein